MAVGTLADLPGPRRLPLAGNALQIRPHELHLLAERRAIVAVGPVETIRSILRARPDEFARWREVREVLGEVDANGIFAAEGGTWRRQRRLAVAGCG
jgi:hypothetical protein